MNNPIPRTIALLLDDMDAFNHLPAAERARKHQRITNEAIKAGVYDEFQRQLERRGIDREDA